MSVIRWRARVRRCPERACERGTLCEGPRTDRAAGEAEQPGHRVATAAPAHADTIVSALAQHLGVDWSHLLPASCQQRGALTGPARAPQERATRDAGLAGVSSLDPPWISTPRLGQPDHPHPSPHGAPRPDHRQPRRGPRSQPKGCPPPAWIAISSCQLHPGGPSGSTSRLPFGEKATPALGAPNARVARWRHLGPVTLTIRSAMTNAVTLSSSTVRSGV